MKSILTKAKNDNKDPYLPILDNFNKQPTNDIHSPAQRLMGRRTKTRLPTSDSLRNFMNIDPEEVNQHRKRTNKNSQRYHDHGKRTLRSLHRGDSCRIQTKDGWIPTKVVRASAEPRSYVVETETRQYRRNRNSLLKTRENIVLPQIKEPENEPEPTPSTGRATPTPQSTVPKPTEAQ